jgi:hypothetical protein
MRSARYRAVTFIMYRASGIFPALSLSLSLSLSSEMRKYRVTRNFRSRRAGELIKTSLSS